MTCSCGDVMSVEAESRDEAVAKLKGTMDQAALDKHVADKHPNMTLTLTDAHAQIEQNLQPAA
ncbi:hypothetical protein C4552_03850 [Candidatus Parcubacteria bacterium]|nr:MAG: hypothetical protein C4552_03850 [Candidatus Parcubacteria bacterium]